MSNRMASRDQLSIAATPVWAEEAEHPQRPLLLAKWHKQSQAKWDPFYIAILTAKRIVLNCCACCDCLQYPIAELLVSV